MLKEFHYKIDWRSKSHLPGHHRSNQSGGGIEFRGNVPLLSSPDPRRLDIRSSLSDPFDQWFVRSFRQRSQVPVYVLADLSASRFELSPGSLKRSRNGVPRCNGCAGSTVSQAMNKPPRQ